MSSLLNSAPNPYKCLTVYACVQVCIMTLHYLSSTRGCLSYRQHYAGRHFQTTSLSVNVALIRFNYSSQPPRRSNRWCHPGSAHSAMTMRLSPRLLSVRLFTSSQERCSHARLSGSLAAHRASRHAGSETREKALILFGKERKAGEGNVWAAETGLSR